MGRSGTRRTIAAIAAIGLAALVIGCGGLALAVRRGAVEPGEIDARVGPFHILGYDTQPAQCPATTPRAIRLCQRYEAVYVPGDYQISIFINSAERDTSDSRLLAHWSLPLSALRAD
jgi:hypothetical protein